MNRWYRTERGFTLVEIVLVVVMLGILATIATMNFATTVDTVKHEATLMELEAIAKAITGNPNVIVNGVRADFGYVGDIGAIPPNLDALINNPGYATWDGPYLEHGLTASDFKRDGWNIPYILLDTIIRSTGSGSSIDKLFARNTASLLANSVSGYINDANGDLPPSPFTDSVRVIITYPGGSGSLASATTSPNDKGFFSFANMPIGNHSIQVIYLPDNDTAQYFVSVNPSYATHLQISFASDLW
ncbi:MAG: prepilin-type N-terminal cleavage/methylation domain-containing protein [candidate division Zixibacteria bacterium]|nr:prepilin-type N-terminal cleavage/methylation domain-containing protein [candidate division Zixibacteria bacterium]